jgi:hypothetical protein
MMRDESTVITADSIPTRALLRRARFKRASFS